MTQMFDCGDPEQRRQGIAAAVSAAKGGGLVVLPTDTVYGIGADAFDAEAVAALLAAKGRGRDMPVPVLVGSWQTIDGLVFPVPSAARDLIEAFWPGALSLVVLGALGGTLSAPFARAERTVTLSVDGLVMEVLTAHTTVDA
ncbi:MAG TPA: Sua5/YciO/YrdC/YwlC family protein, partial [Mycobacterium sp.]|nr:Sua5/YciO/YrdC/YwlC family protein [Mycobacterium sp.]